MTKQEMLYEQYNDALFRLLMHSVAQHQGQQYQEENQALKAQEGGPSETGEAPVSADDLPAGKAGPRPRRSPDGVAGPQ